MFVNSTAFACVYKKKNATSTVEIRKGYFLVSVKFIKVKFETRAGNYNLYFLTYFFNCLIYQSLLKLLLFSKTLFNLLSTLVITLIDFEIKFYETEWICK